MRLLSLFWFSLALSVSSSIQSEEVFIPEPFRNGEMIEQIIVISDVDGVVRDSVEAIADPRVINAVKLLLENDMTALTFISGTPIDNDSSLEPWRRGSVPLNKVFGSSFEKELSENRVAIFGVLGGHQMQCDGKLEVVDEYSPEIAVELGSLLIHAFLREVMSIGTAPQKELAQALQAELNALQFEHSSSRETAPEFNSIVSAIREHLDPDFRLISNGALIETHTTNPPWSTALSYKWIQDEINRPQYLVSKLALSQKQMATGLAKRGDQGFNYLLISKTNKGLTTSKHIAERLKQFPKALIVTIGDTQVDFPMHKNAHLAFHVGLEEVWRNNPLAQCVMIRNASGQDSQHVEGTLKVLNVLQEGIGKSFYELKYIPRQDSSGRWDYYSLNELQDED